MVNLNTVNSKFHQFEVNLTGITGILFVKTVDTNVKTHLHIPAHNFLNIQPIFNPKKFWKAETEGFSTIYINTIYMC